MLIVIASKQASKQGYGINIDQCRIESNDAPAGRSRHGGGRMQGSSWQMPDSVSCMPAGRWPSNLVLHSNHTFDRFFKRI